MATIRDAGSPSPPPFGLHSPHALAFGAPDTRDMDRFVADLWACPTQQRQPSPHFSPTPVAPAPPPASTVPAQASADRFQPIAPATTVGLAVDQDPASLAHAEELKQAIATTQRLTREFKKLGGRKTNGEPTYAAKLHYVLNQYTIEHPEEAQWAHNEKLGHHVIVASKERFDALGFLAAFSASTGGLEGRWAAMRRSLSTWGFCRIGESKQSQFVIYHAQPGVFTPGGENIDTLARKDRSKKRHAADRDADDTGPVETADAAEKRTRTKVSLATAGVARRERPPQMPPFTTTAAVSGAPHASFDSVIPDFDFGDLLWDPPKAAEVPSTAGHGHETALLQASIADLEARDTESQRRIALLRQETDQLRQQILTLGTTFNQFMASTTAQPVLAQPPSVVAAPPVGVDPFNDPLNNLFNDLFHDPFNSLLTQFGGDQA